MRRGYNHKLSFFHRFTIFHQVLVSSGKRKYEYYRVQFWTQIEFPFFFFMWSRAPNTHIYKCLASVYILWGVISQRMCPFIVRDSSVLQHILSCLPPHFLTEDSVRSKHLILLWVLMVKLYWPKTQRLIHKTDAGFQNVKY